MKKLSIKYLKRINSEDSLLTLIIVVLRFSYLHSHLGQNSFSFPTILPPTLGRITPSQLLILGSNHDNCMYSLYRLLSFSYHLKGGTFSMKSIRSLPSLVLLITELMEGQMHLHLLSS